MNTPSSETAALSPAQRKALKARAHSLHPVVTIGDKGLSPAVLREIDVNLKSHELIKVKAATDDRDAREGFLAQICTGLFAHPVQHIGKILVVYRPRPESQEQPAAPRKPAVKRMPAAARKPVKRTAVSPEKPVREEHKRSPARPARARPAGAGRFAVTARPGRPTTRTGPAKPGSRRRPK